ncbi:MAG: preprotein translocase subunit SecY [Chloroflexi bacterium]|nr:preprotein translocase subunit SecY [Chloroflexota bacterium]MCY3581054.1 preprotein translocase subunit SecY [Chloroflexota bacterium]MCY3715243.1 preprotein translocase subunit SecY [Chloroflexota bacterium]MXX50198.1 preprotein translocase subunit SecY [Chloroflexota bacterium]MYA93546.1 preprotein translocase subunit SecY [Chloroflexota bacterium]
MIQALRNAWRLPDVRNKLLFTIFILIVYQFAAHVPVVGVDRNVLRQVFESGSSAGNLIQVMNLLSGGAVANFSVIANGVYPYITASIIFQLLVPIVPALERIQREPGGQEKIQRYTYFVSIPMAVLQALGQISIFNLATGTGAEIIPGFGFGMGSDILLTVSVLTTMTAGTMFAIWLGELITEQGIGNGISIIIFAGIVALAPQNLIQLLTQQPDRALYNLTLFIVITLLSVVAVVVIQEGVRRVPVQYGRRVRGNRQFAQQDSFIPLRVNPVGMIPLIFAQSIITFPAIIASLFPPGAVGNTIQTTFGNQQGLLYWGTFFLMTVGFTFFYAEVMVGNQNLAENLQRNGGFIPGIRPGKRTEDFIKSTTRRITFVGAFFLGVIAIIPGVVDLVNRIIFPLEASAGGAVMNAGLVISGSGLIIVVGVVIDTMRQLEAQLVMRNYEGFMR